MMISLVALVAGLNSEPQNRRISNIECQRVTNPQKVRNSVMPAKAGIQNYLKTLDSRLRGNDVKGRI